LSRRRVKSPKRQARHIASAKRIVILGAANRAAKRKTTDIGLTALQGYMDFMQILFQKPPLGLDFTQNQAKFNRRRCIIKNKFAKEQKWCG